MKNRTIEASEMKLIPSLIKYTSPESIPLAFKMNGKEYRGLGGELSPDVKFIRINSDLAKTEIRAEVIPGLEVCVEYYEYFDFPVTEWVAYFTNKGSENTPVISDIRVVDALLPGEGEATLTHSRGDDSTVNGYTYYHDKLDRKISLYPHGSLSARGAAPFFTLAFGDHTVRGAVGWSGGWVASFEPEERGVRFSCGQLRCNMYIMPGETMRTPRVTLLGHTGDDARGINIWRRFYMTHILPKPDGMPIPPLSFLYLYLEGGLPEFAGCTEKGQLAAMRKFLDAGIKPDFWWIDAGWYPCDKVWQNVGTWTHDPERFPNGLGSMSREMKKEGIDLLLWFEPERVVRGSEIDREHPEFLLTVQPDDGKSDKLFDLGNPSARKWMTDKVCGIIKEAGVKIYRQDFNFIPGFVWDTNEDDDRIGALENLHIQGYYAYWDELLIRNPGLIFDSCAGGGRRNDIETMRRAVPIHYTDVGRDVGCFKQYQHRYLFEWTPYFRQFATSDYPLSPSDSLPYHLAIAPAITPIIAFIDRQDPEYYELTRRMLPIWREAAELTLDGDYYPLTEVRHSNEDYYAMQFDLPAEERGFFQVIRNSEAPEDSFTVKLHALEAGDYLLENKETGEKKIVSASELTCGYDISIPRASGTLWFYKKA